MFGARGNVHIEAASDFFKMTKAFPTSTLNSEPDRDDEMVKWFQRVHYWPKCEVPAGSEIVCLSV